jgi:2-dehydro-3-deoxygluconokinase
MMKKTSNIEVVSFGEPLIGIYPPDNCSIADDVPLSKTWGGDTSNVALALSKLGHKAAYITRVGDDGFGHSFLKLWCENNVDTSQVKVDTEHRTGLYFISYQDGKHVFTYYRRNSAASWISPEDIDWEFLREVKVLHLSGISQAISQHALEVSVDLLNFAKQHHILVSYDVNYRPPLWKTEIAKAVISYAIEEYADILEITDDEMKLLGWGERPEELVSHFSRTPQICAVKMGEQGCYVRQNEKEIRVKPFSMDVVDTVGAGDAFDAGLIVGVLEEMEFERLAEFANAVAVLTCRDVGPLRAQPTREEVERLLESSPDN